MTKRRLGQALGLICAINAREDVSEQDALLAGAFAAGSLTPRSGSPSVMPSAARRTTHVLRALLTAPELRPTTGHGRQAPICCRATSPGAAGVESRPAAGVIGLRPVSRLLAAANRDWQRATRSGHRDGNLALSVDSRSLAT